MKRNIDLKILRILLLIWLLPTVLNAEIRFSYPAHFANLSTGFYFRSWNINEPERSYKITQGAFPITAISPFTDRLNVLFSTSHSTALLNRNLEDHLQGVADGKIKAFYQVIPNHLLLNTGISVPFGKNRLTTKEINVAEVLYESILGFGVTRFGEGLDAEIGLSTAFQLSRNFTLGAGFGYLRKGEYQFHRVSEIKFQPGSEFSANLGLDFYNDSLFVRSDFLFKTYTTDKLDAKAYLKQGIQLEFTSRFNYQNFPLQLNLLIKHVYKANNKFYGSPDYFLSEGMNFIDHSSWLKTSLMYHLNGQQAFSAKLGLNRFGKSDLQWGDALIFNGGLGIHRKISEYVIARIEAQYLRGNAVKNTIKINGWDFSMVFSFRI
jgi:hypothetical protein